MKFTPLTNRIVVEPLKAQDEVVNGILIPASQLGEGTLRGTVVAAGPTATVTPGAIVVHSKYGFDELKDGGRTYYVMPEDLVLATIEADALVAG